ncbi:MAG: hypothetical protein CDV28_1585 [Candidatus Electronema aureum]|uniref:Uncharacterized protein n=1 Tax=Candidatus Electronema aureum TaxID=2005002 RepID=A0A521FYF6_9BACT|nr:MAG: hypothetical protein CDV28_1585 [Candidatus Electronema aureum]
MSSLRIEHIDPLAARRYRIATTAEKQAAAQLLNSWLTDDAASLELLIRQRRQTREKVLHQQAAEYFSSPPTFPLNWADNKLSREEMNER